MTVFGATYIPTTGQHITVPTNLLYVLKSQKGSWRAAYGPGRADLAHAVIQKPSRPYGLVDSTGYYLQSFLVA